MRFLSVGWPRPAVAPASHWSGHRRLLAVLRRGDPEAAREEMVKHLDAVRQHLQIG
jgi:DNA-binding FadR family transcriptional regulator